MLLRNDPKCTQTLWNAPKHEFRVQWDGLSAFFVKKLQCDFVARTFALSAPVHPVLHQVCSYETIPNAPKHYETHQNMSLGSNGVDQVCSLRKITTWLRGTNFCINCTSSHRFAPSFMQLRNHNKCAQKQRNYENMSLGSNGVDWVRSLRKIASWLRGMNFCINCTSSPCFVSSFMQLRNDPKCIPTLCNAPKHEFRVQNEADWVRSLRKIQTWLRGTNFFINCFNSHRFAPSFMQLRNHNKCTQTQWNLWKYEFRVQWGGLGAFIAKNPVVTLWHELLH